MTAGLGVSGLVAAYVASHAQLAQFILGSKLRFIGPIILQLVFVVIFALLVQKVSAILATALFFAFAVLIGLTLSVFRLNEAVIDNDNRDDNDRDNS